MISLALLCCLVSFIIAEADVESLVPSKSSGSLNYTSAQPRNDQQLGDGLKIYHPDLAFSDAQPRSSRQMGDGLETYYQNLMISEDSDTARADVGGGQFGPEPPSCPVYDPSDPRSNPAVLGWEYSGKTSCLFWCRTPQNFFFCCVDEPAQPSQIAPVKPGLCPLGFADCLLLKNLPLHEQPIMCINDFNCPYSMKCCYDQCSASTVCMQAQHPIEG